MNYKTKSKFFTFLILALFSLNSFGNQNSKEKLISELDLFYNKLKENGLLLRHDFNHYRQNVKSAKNELEFIKGISNTEDYLGFILVRAKKMSILQSSKNLISDTSFKVINQIQEIKKSLSLKPATPVIEKKIEILEENNIKKVFEDKKLKKLVETAPILKQINDIKPVQVIQKEKSYTGLWYLLGSFGIFSFIMTFLFRRNREEVFVEENVKSERVKTKASSLMLKNYKHSQAPVILLNDDDFIDWSNEKAQSNLELTAGSSFFLENELTEDFAKNQFVYEFNKTKYSIVIKPIVIKATKKKLIVFIPTTEKAFQSYKLVEKSLPLSSAIKASMEKYGYLFTESGIPIFFDSRVDEGKVDEREAKVFERVLLLSYSLCKDITGARVNFILESNKNSSIIQLDIRGIKKSQINFNEKISIKNTSNYSYADYFHELELELSNRNARVFCFDNDEIEGVTFQFSMSKNSYVENQIQ